MSYDIIFRSTKWQIKELEFYSDSGCIGAQFDNGNPIDSNNAGADTGPDKGFDKKEGTKWGGRWEDDIKKEIWLGMEFGNPVKVLCVSFVDDNVKLRSTSLVKVQAYNNNLDTWIDLVTADHNHGERQDLPITVVPGTSVPTPTKPPIDLENEKYEKNDTGDISYKKMHNRNPDCSDYIGSYWATITNSETQTTLTMDFDITADATKCVFKSNNIPNHNVGGSIKPNVDDYILNLPRNPVKNNVATDVKKKGGKLTLNGILLNGVDLDMDSAFCYNPAFDTPNHISLGTGNSKCGIKDYHWYAIPAANPDNVALDEYAGHPYQGRYHYHGDNEALSFLKAADVFSDYGSPVVGFAPDGFPIYGHYFYDEDINDVRKAKSGWQIKKDFKNGRTPLSGASFDPPPIETHKLGIFVEDWEYDESDENPGDLDECNGMTDAFGNYGYYYTETYPYGPKCTFGTPDPSFTKEGCEYNSGDNGCINKFAFVMASGQVEHGHEHGVSNKLVTAGAAQSVKSVSVVVIAATGVIVMSVL